MAPIDVISVPLRTGLVKVLFVSVSVPVKETKLSPCIAVLNSASEPEIVLESKSIDLLVNVSVVSLPTKVCVAFCIVTILSAVGFETVKVVSKSFEVEPSNFKEFWTCISVEFTVVVVPWTVKSPVTVKSEAVVMPDQAFDTRNFIVLFEVSNQTSF